MKYHKPAVTILAAATDSIQLIFKDCATVFDGGTLLCRLTLNAYGADE